MDFLIHAGSICLFCFNSFVQVKPVQAILQLLWDMAHIPEIPKHLVERAFAEHLATINEMTLNKDAIRRQYVLQVKY